MKLKNYIEQESSWPCSGEHIMAQYDNDSIWVYQAYSPLIASYAIQHQRFGGAFSYDRMSWIKPNFLWMMYRSDWARKQGQEVVLAIQLRRAFFDEIAQLAVSSSFHPSQYTDHAAWKSAVQDSDVRLQWDPDHDPYGAKCERRAIQLGLRGKILERYGKSEILRISDVTPIVQEQLQKRDRNLADLEVPEENPYPQRWAST